MSIWHHRSCPTVKVFCVFLSIIPINHHYLTGFCGEFRSETKYNVSGTIGIFDYVSRSAFDGARGTLFGISEWCWCALCVEWCIFCQSLSMLLNILHAFRAHTGKDPYSNVIWRYGDFRRRRIFKSGSIETKRKTMALSSLLLVAGMGRTWGKNQTKFCFLRRTPLARDISQRMWTNYQGEVEVAPLKIVVKSKYIPYRHFIAETSKPKIA